VGWRSEVALVFKDDLPLNEFVEVRPRPSLPYAEACACLRRALCANDEFRAACVPGCAYRPLSHGRLVAWSQLPETLSALNYSNIVCGVVRGSLEMVQFKVQCRFGSDTLQGADVSEVHVVLTEVLAEMPPNDED
jgi:hypothetical protein